MNTPDLTMTLALTPAESRPQPPRNPIGTTAAEVAGSAPKVAAWLASLTGEETLACARFACSVDYQAATTAALTAQPSDQQWTEIRDNSDHERARAAVASVGYSRADAGLLTTTFGDLLRYARSAEILADQHPDLVAALRGPLDLACDFIEHWRRCTSRAMRHALFDIIEYTPNVSAKDAADALLAADM